MYGICYNNFCENTLECIATFESYKVASESLTNTISKYSDWEPSIRPITIWKEEEFDICKVQTSQNTGFWVEIKASSGIVYNKRDVNGWFSYAPILKVGSFTIIEIPEVCENSPIVCYKIPKNTNKKIIGSCDGGTNIMKELKIKLRERNEKGVQFVMPQRENVKNQKHETFIQDLKCKKKTLKNF